MNRLPEIMAERAAAVEEELRRLLPTDDCPEVRLWEAMQYSCLNGGKRLRPFLVMTTASLFKVSEKRRSSCCRGGGDGPQLFPGP